MNIREASMLTGISKDMLRYYEKIGLLSPRRNVVNRYRDYSIIDINNAVMIREYSNLGISLKSLAELFRHGDIHDALSELQLTVSQLEKEVELTRAKLANVRDYARLFSMLQDNIPFDTGYCPVSYYYQRPDEPYLFSSADPGFADAYRMIFRITPEHIQSDPFPVDQGFLSMHRIEGSALSCVEIPAHSYWRTIVEEEPDGVMNQNKLRPVLKQMKRQGYALHGNIILYQIMNATRDNLKKLVCIECDVGTMT